MGNCWPWKLERYDETYEYEYEYEYACMNMKMQIGGGHVREKTDVFWKYFRF